MSRKADVRDLIKIAEAQGCEVTMGKSGHWKVYGPSGGLLTTLAASPDGPFREKAIADFKRAGIIDCDPKLKGHKKKLRRDKRV